MGRTVEMIRKRYAKSVGVPLRRRIRYSTLELGKYKLPWCRAGGGRLGVEAGVWAGLDCGRMGVREWAGLLQA